MITMKIYKRSDLLTIAINVTIIPKVGELVEISDIIYEVKNIVWHMSDVGTWIEVQVV